MNFKIGIVLHLMVMALTFTTLAHAEDTTCDSGQSIQSEFSLAASDPISCNSAQAKRLFEACIYHRANCQEYCSGGYCHGVPSLWGQCTGTRPPRLGCCGIM